MQVEVQYSQTAAYDTFARAFASSAASSLCVWFVQNDESHRAFGLVLFAYIKGDVGRVHHTDAVVAFRERLNIKSHKLSLQCQA